MRLKNSDSERGIILPAVFLMIFIITLSLGEAISAKQHALQLATDSTKSIPLSHAHHKAVTTSLNQLSECSDLKIESIYHKTSYLVCPIIPSKLRTSPPSTLSDEGFDIRHLLEAAQKCPSLQPSESSSSTFSPRSNSDCLFENISTSLSVRENIRVSSLGVDSSKKNQEIVVFSPGEIVIDNVEITGGTVLLVAGGDLIIKRVSTLSSLARLSVISLKGAVTIKENRSKSGIFIAARKNITSPQTQKLIGAIHEYPVPPTYQGRRLLGWAN